MIPRYLKWPVDYAGNIRYLDSAQITRIVSFATSHNFSSQVQGSEYGQSLDRFERENGILEVKSTSRPLSMRCRRMVCEIVNKTK